MAISLPDLVGKIKIDDSQLKQLPNTFSGVSGKISSVGATMTKSLSLPILAVGAGLVKLGSEFDDAADTIRVGTGATGKSLEGLQTSFRNVVKDVPTDFGSAGEAIADLNTRTGLTGKALEDLAKQELELSRITGTDLKTNIEATTRVFGDWGIASEDQATALDKLFRASQTTGIGVDQLAAQVVQFGAPLRQMGFSFEESIGLLGKFEKEGVNSELVMGSLRIALGKLAKEGKEPVQAFKEQTEAIKNAGDAGKANALAMELFGARAGPDMAAAIREGRFELGDLFDTISNGEETILSAASDTEDFAEKWTKVKNSVFLAIEPLATKLFDAIARGMETITPLIERVAKGFGEMSPQMQNLIIGGAAFVAALGPIVFMVGKLIPLIGGLVKAFQSVMLVMRLVQLLFVANPFGLLIVAIIGLTALIVANWDTIKEATLTAWNWVKDHIGEIMRVVLAVLTGGLSELVLWVVRNWDEIKAKTSEIWNGVKSFLSNTWNDIKAGASAVWSALTSFISDRWNTIKSNTSAIWEGIKNFLSSAWNAIKSAASSAWNAITGAVTNAVNNVRNVIQNVFNGIKSAVSGAWNFVRDSITNAINLARNNVSSAINAIKGFFDGLLSKIRSVVNFINSNMEKLAFWRNSPSKLEINALKTVQGINKAFGQLVPMHDVGVNALTSASAMSARLSPATASSAGYSPTYNIYVNGVFDLTDPNVAWQFAEKAVPAIQTYERAKT